MGAVKKIWNEMDDATDARDSGGADFQSSPLTVDTSLSLPDMSSRVIALCKDLFNKWSKLDDSRFSVETVSGGITNLLLKVSVKEDNGNDVSVTVRLYGPNTDYVINRQRELQAIKYLSAAGFGAKLLGVFGNGMVQSFINARTLVPSDMRNPKLAAEIAKQLRKFHQVEIPGSKEPQLWNDVSKFYEKASGLEFDDTEKQRMYEAISFKEVHKEIVELKVVSLFIGVPAFDFFRVFGQHGDEKLAELAGHLHSPVVFAHNDLLSGNIMVNDEQDAPDSGIQRMKCDVSMPEMVSDRHRRMKKKLYFIDFEYGSYNYRGFDIGNHFNEYAGYDCDYSLYPNKEEQFHFFRHYLQPDKPDEVSDKDLEALHVEANTFMLASHLFWALWALIQAKMSPIDFDYLGYFFMRYNEYKKQKEMCFSLAQSYLSKLGTG
ncbi:hypothetical protein JRO89_XS04G0245300 [Xanthoceras sorbifolium]|uniref:ethanolamine kinase n=1 Tax=Xanthoceras sorbifolium TaxID=99658 RepID=A0ABQ8I6V7_9ROSI|nr:hypothetical protein JRO89_XS04G0245300 [Xanthoceras sorbifolium]